MTNSIDDDIASSNHSLDHLLDELAERFGTKTAHPEQLYPPADSIRFVSEAGRLIIPSEPIWAAHRRLVLNPDCLIGYSHSRFPQFDNIIHQNLLYRPITDVDHRDYPQYHILRENIAIVRNVVMVEFFQSPLQGSALDQRLLHLTQIAHLIVEGLNNDRPLFNPLKPRIHKSLANVPGSGARHIYEQILKRQDSTYWLSAIINLLFGPRPWRLPAVEASPFSSDNLQKPCVADEHPVYPEDLAFMCDMMDRHTIDPMEMSTVCVEGVNHIADDLSQSSAMHNSIDSLREPTRRESVEIAKDILRKLKVKLGSALIVNGLTSVTSSNFAILDAIKGVVGVYEFHLHLLLQLDPKALLNPTIAAANDAIGKLGYLAKTEALRVARKTGNHRQVKLVSEQIKKMPERWHRPKEQTLGQLFEQVENGLGAVMTRISQLSDPKAAVTNFMGRQNFQAIGAVDPEFERRNNPQQAMSNNDYFQQINAQRQQQQQVQQAKQAQASQQQAKPLERDVVNKSASNAPKTQNMKKLVNPNDIASMRNQMKTDKNAAPVLVGSQARQAQLNQDRAMQEQAQRQQRMKAIQNANRAKQQEEESRSQQENKNEKQNNEAAKYQEAAHKSTSMQKLAGEKIKANVKESSTSTKDTSSKVKDSTKLKTPPPQPQAVEAPKDTKMIEAPLNAPKKKDPTLLR